ncbi:MAG: regulatory protein MarR [Acidimicrobiia bacterium]|nr:regulatory protein MarR [Acidimicrobiia bacterium]
MPGRRLADDPIQEAASKWVEHGWEPAAAGMAVLTSIMRVQQMLIARVDDELRPFGLTLARYEVLMLLVFSRSGALPMGKVGERLQVHPASVTNAMDRLEKQGLVERRSDPNDGRRLLASITAEGRSLAHTATAALNSNVFSQVALSPTELAELFGLLRKLRHAAGDFA